MKIKIVKEKATDYTFVSDELPASRGEEAQAEGKKKERKPDPRFDREIKKIKFKSKLTGGHNKQGHSPVYE